MSGEAQTKPWGALATERVAELVELLDEAFQGPRWHSLRGNLVTDNWMWVAPGGRRSIRDVVAHVGGCKFMDHNQALGDGRDTWNDLPRGGR